MSGVILVPSNSYVSHLELKSWGRLVNMRPRWFWYDSPKGHWIIRLCGLCCRAQGPIRDMQVVGGMIADGRQWRIDLCS